MIVRLPRTVISVHGEGAREWLDGLLTQTVREDASVFAALLTPQGKIIADMIVTPEGGGLRLDTPEAMGGELLKRLKMYVLRAPIAVEDVSSELSVFAAWGEDADMGGRPDPRHPTLGTRVLAASASEGGDLADYDAHRLSLGVPDSLFDYGSGEVFPHDADMDELNGIDLKKGCFVGQEVVSRMARLASVRKRMRGVVLSGAAEAGNAILGGTRRVGDLLHVRGNMGMALVRLDRMEAATESPTVNGESVQIMDGPNG